MSNPPNLTPDFLMHLHDNFNSWFTFTPPDPVPRHDPTPDFFFCFMHLPNNFNYWFTSTPPPPDLPRFFSHLHNKFNSLFTSTPPPDLTLTPVFFGIFTITSIICSHPLEFVLDIFTVTSIHHTNPRPDLIFCV